MELMLHRDIPSKQSKCTGLAGVGGQGIGAAAFKPKVHGLKSVIGKIFLD